MRGGESVFALVLFLSACVLPGRDCAPVYGNWCGKGYPSEGDPPTINQWDLACRTHDKCYESKGEGNKSCDLQFAETLNRFARLGEPPIEMKAAYDLFATKTGQQLGATLYFDPKSLINWVTADCKGANIGADRWGGTSYGRIESGTRLPEGDGLKDSGDIHLNIIVPLFRWESEKPPLASP